MDSIKQIVGDKISSTVTVVNNTATAMVVIYKVASDPKYLDTITFLLKKAIKQKIKSLGTNPLIAPLIKAMWAMFPKNRNVQDFLKALFIVSILNVIGMAMAKAKDWIKGQVEDQLVSFIKSATAKVMNLDSLIAAMGNANAIFGLMAALGVANEVLFRILDYMNDKIITAPGGTSA